MASRAEERRKKKKRKKSAMKKVRTNRRTVQFTDQQMEQWRKECKLFAEELPDLATKHQRIRDAAEERSHSGALRRAIHSSNILLHDLASRADSGMKTLDAFLTGARPLTSDVIDRLTRILKLKLEPANGKRNPRGAKAG
jgi:hypothetical protein